MPDIDIYPKRVAIIVGHAKGAPGSSNPSVGTEWDYNSMIAETPILKEVADIFYYDNFKKGYVTTVIEDMAPKTKNYDLVVELHFNSFYYEQANGVEGLYYYKNENMRILCEEFCDRIHYEFGSIIRGAKALKGHRDRGFACVYYQTPPTIMVEPFFCTGLEADNFDEPHEKERYAKVLRELIAWYEINY